MDFLSHHLLSDRMLIIVGIVLFLILPIVAIIKCATSALSNRRKALWIVAMLLTFPLGPYVYFIIHAKSRVLKILSIISPCLLILSLTLQYTGMDKRITESQIEKAEQKRQTSKIDQIEDIITKINEYSGAERSPNTAQFLEKIKTDLRIIQDELRTFSYRESQPLMRHMLEIEFLAYDIIRLDDTTLTDEKILQWNQVFGNRHYVSPEEAAERKKSLDKIREAQLFFFQICHALFENLAENSTPTDKLIIDAAISDLNVVKAELRNGTLDLNQKKFRAFNEFCNDKLTVEKLKDWPEIFANRHNTPPNPPDQ